MGGCQECWRSCKEASAGREFASEEQETRGLDAKAGPSHACWVTPACIKWGLWTSLVAQWLRIRLPMQGARVQTLVQEDPTCHGAIKPLRHNY
ncbi:hypothetical protein J1605_020703 [Eschrichtius robustus]|uniref:Uncharacterized protein n=1 Tax=Eschrichtius robustus TaxID=9764 RepID=A0AB34HJ82_ESCRO|nr:hypothetical protein J1605_020703 [Eschrichtius robustus]